MAIKVKRWIGTNGEILIPIQDKTYNDSILYSTNGTIFIVQREDDVVIQTGNPIGLLLTLTYS